ncbi:MAG: hypothetical protein JSS81_30040 [Acidobacteria bacterium]|nr:hypothetical protein [Acidobacteriota bacterium]
MLDTIGVKQIFRNRDYTKLLENSNWFQRYQKGKRKHYTYQTPKGSKLPRLTFSQTFNNFWHLYAEVSLPSWAKGFNYPLSSLEELPDQLAELTAFVNDKIAIGFDAERARVQRVDFAEDITLPPHIIAKAIASLNRSNPAKFDRLGFKNETIYFNRKNQHIVVYNKTKQAESVGHFNISQENLGVLRLEVRLASSRIKNIAKKLGLPDTSAHNIFQKIVADKVIEEAKMTICLEDALNDEPSIVKRLRSKFNGPELPTVLGWAVLLSEFGDTPSLAEYIGVNPRTQRRHVDRLKSMGIPPTSHEFDMTLME